MLNKTGTVVGQINNYKREARLRCLELAIESKSITQNPIELAQQYHDFVTKDDIKAAE
jgi:hypothetical protein